MKTRRTRLVIRQKGSLPNFAVGYWDRKKTSNPDRDFRTFGIVSSFAEAEELAKIIAKQRREFLYRP